MDAITIIVTIAIIFLIYKFGFSRKEVEWTYICNKCGYKTTMNQQLKVFVCPQCHTEETIDWRDGHVQMLKSGSSSNFSGLGVFRSIFGGIGLLLAIISVLITCISFLPFLGWGNWVGIPVSIFALLFSAIGGTKSGTIISIIMIVIGIIRLLIGGGVG